MATGTMFPLETASTADLQGLCEVLWKWPICAGCKQANETCTDRYSCLWSQRSRQLEHFFDLYRSATAPYLPDSIFPSAGALNSHGELLEVIKHVRNHRDKPRSQVTSTCFAPRSQLDRPEPSQNDQHRALSLAVRVMTTVSNKAEGVPGALLESGSASPPTVWRNDKSLAEYLHSLFQKRHHQCWDEDEVEGESIHQPLTAVALRKVAGLRIVGTDDISRHLRVDGRTGSVEIFHHVAVLNEHLEAIVYRKAAETLPIDLIRETLGTLVMLFPPDRESTALLRMLISKKGFDPLMRHVCTISTRHAAVEDDSCVKYGYWGSRLVDLCDEIENPKPRGLLNTWLEQRSKARHVMLATMAGIIAAVILGILSLGVSIFQAWLTYKQWKDAS